MQNTYGPIGPPNTKPMGRFQDQWAMTRARLNMKHAYKNRQNDHLITAK
jgi:hypothetical protein